MLSQFSLFSKKNHQMKQVQQGLYVACMSIIVFLSTTPATTAFSPSHEKQKHTNNRLLMVRFTSRVSPLSSLFRVRSPGSHSSGIGSPSCRVLEVVSVGRTWSSSSSARLHQTGREAPVPSCVRSSRTIQRKGSVDGWMRKARKGWGSRNRRGEGGGEGVLPLAAHLLQSVFSKAS